MLRHTVLILAMATALAACNKGPDKDGKTAGKDDKDAKPAVTLQLAPEDVLTLQSGTLASGPSITGTIQPERRADLRAEVGAVVLQVFKENGDPVRRGDLLVRLDDTSIRDSVNSADEAARASTQSFDQAQRQFERFKTLRESGMASTQQLEDAEVRRNNAQSDLSAAKTRAVQARQQLQRTETRAPFDGIVSERKVSAGDTAQVGKELLKVIDPSSMRFEALVSADAINDVKAGQAVMFRVNGYGQQDFAGKVRRVNPSANATTRQAEVLIDFVDRTQPKLAGLYAEGRIEAGSTQALLLPESALQRDGDKAYAWRVVDNKLQKVTLALGERDPRRGGFAVRSGLVQGDRVIRSPSSNFKDGQMAVNAQPLGSTVTASSAANNAASSPLTSMAPPAAAPAASASASAPARS